MQNSLKRVKMLIDGETPDRPPLFELLRNDAVISYFVQKKLTLNNAAEVVYKAYAPAIDATRTRIALPQRKTVMTREDQRRLNVFRWTSWLEPIRYANGEAYAMAKRKEIEAFDPVWTSDNEESLQKQLQGFASLQRRLGEVFVFPALPHLGLAMLYNEIGLEMFSYYMMDYPDIIAELLELQTIKAIRWIEHLPENHGLEACFIGEDIAFNSGLLFSPVWLRKYFFPRLTRVIEAYHRRHIKVLFHSDGNLNVILDDLAKAGIDGLNPLETLADMNIGVIHRRYPHWFLAGGIDVSQLLPFGKPRAIKEAVKNALGAAEGRLMPGSSTELNNVVPLANYLALREAVLEAVDE